MYHLWGLTMSNKKAPSPKDPSGSLSDLFETQEVEFSAEEISAHRAAASGAPEETLSDASVLEEAREMAEQNRATLIDLEAAQPQFSASTPAPHETIESLSYDPEPHAYSSMDNLTESTDAEYVPFVIGDRYQVLELLGEGGMGFVYRVRDMQLDEIVALKMLRPDMLNHPGAVERFKREVKLARRVTHPHVARIFDLGQHEGGYYLTMELIEGESLADLIDRERVLPLPFAAAVAIAMGEGLEAAHQAHIVHRDLKPSNVLLTHHDGRVVLSDFGIAGVDFHKGGPEATGSPLGTPAYMSPEQLQGQQDIDSRADIYSFGLILYELFSGHRAWVDNNSFALIYKRLSGAQPRSLRELRPELPEELLAVVERCTVWDRHTRYQRAAEIVADLKRWLPSKSPERPVTTMPTDPFDFLTVPMIHSPPRWQALVQRVATPTQIGNKRLAVVPFEAGAQIDDYVSQGLAEELVDLLSIMPGIKVRPMRLVRATQTMSPVELGQHLDVDILVEGSLRPMGEDLHVRVRMLSGQGGYQLWAHRFVCRDGDLFKLAEEITSAIAGALTVKHESGSRLTTTNPEAIELYFRARQLQRDNWYGDLRESASLFEQALTLAPDDPLILVRATMTYARLSFYQRANKAECLSRARELAEKALLANPRRGEPFYALGLVRYYDLGQTEAAVDALCTALERAPHFPEALELLGRILMEIGPVEDGLALAQKAVLLDPMMIYPRWDMMRAHALLGQWEQVIQLGDLPVESPNNKVLRAIARARMDMWLNKPHWKDDELPDTQWSQQILSVGVKALFEVRLTRQVPNDLIELVFPWLQQERIGRLQLALIQPTAEALAYAGRLEECLHILSLASDNGLLDLMWLHGCPLFRQLHQHPHFIQIYNDMQGRIETLHANLMQQGSFTPPV